MDRNMVPGAGAPMEGYGAGNPLEKLRPLIEFMASQPPNQQLDAMILPMIMQMMSPEYQQQKTWGEEDRAWVTEEQGQRRTDQLYQEIANLRGFMQDAMAEGRESDVEAYRQLLRRKEMEIGVVTPEEIVPDWRQAHRQGIQTSMDNKMSRALGKGQDMSGYEDIIGRGPEAIERWGVAPTEEERWAQAQKAFLGDGGDLKNIGKALYGIINPYQAGQNILDLFKGYTAGDDIRLGRDYSGYGL
jgi:hypothetical protein